MSRSERRKATEFSYAKCCMNYSAAPLSSSTSSPPRPLTGLFQPCLNRKELRNSAAFLFFTLPLIRRANCRPCLRFQRKADCGKCSSMFLSPDCNDSSWREQNRIIEENSVKAVLILCLGGMLFNIQVVIRVMRSDLIISHYTDIPIVLLNTWIRLVRRPGCIYSVNVM